jgi:hypothetical protein
MFAKQKNKHGKACNFPAHLHVYQTHSITCIKKLKKTYVRQFIWLTRVFLSILFNKGHMYNFFWTEGQKKKNIMHEPMSAFRRVKVN